MSGLLRTTASICKIAAMRTTVDLPEALLRQLKAQAALEGTSLKQLVLALVERGLQSPAVSPASLRSRSPLPKLALDQPLSVKQFSNATLFELLETGDLRQRLRPF
jgi:hypothetical protein